MKKIYAHVCLLMSLLSLLSCSASRSIADGVPSTPVQGQVKQSEQSSLSAQKGVTWQIEQMWGDWPRTRWDAVAQDAADIHNANITWARVSLPQDHPFAYFDKVVQLARQYHIRLLALVYKSNPSNDLGSLDQRNAYKNWLAQAVQRYKSDVHYWEIQNEVNGPQYWNIDSNPDSNQAAYDASVGRFVQDMQDSYETIHANDSRSYVLYGGISQDNAERYIDSMIKQQAYRYMDIMAFHPYGSDAEVVVSRLRMLQSKMATRPGFASKPIWITEIGFHTQANWKDNPGYVPSEDVKAQRLVETIRALWANGVSATFWYTLHEPDNLNGYGLTRRDPTTLHTTYLAAYNAYKRL